MKLKRYILLPVAVFFTALATYAASVLAPVTVTLQNKCTHPVKYEVKGGAASSGTIEANGKQKLSLEPGVKVYVDGELCLAVSAADNNTTFVVCR